MLTYEQKIIIYLNRHVANFGYVKDNFEIRRNFWNTTGVKNKFFRELNDYYWGQPVAIKYTQQIQRLRIGRLTVLHGRQK